MLSLVYGLFYTLKSRNSNSNIFQEEIFDERIDEDIDDMDYQTLYRCQIKRKRNRNFEEKLNPNRKRARTKHKMQIPLYSDFPF